MQADGPEWQALVHSRDEIEQDPTLENDTRRVLLSNWRAMADEVQYRTEAHSQFEKSSVGGLRVPKFTLMIGTLLCVVSAFLVTYLTGGINSGSSQLPTQHVENVDQAIVANSGHPSDGTNLKERLAVLEQKLKENPSDLRGWVLLAKTQAALADYASSAKSLKKALELTPGHPDLLADLADVTDMANGKNLLGEPETYLRQALKNDPNNEKALALAATAAEQAHNEPLASALWKKLGIVQQTKLAPNPSQAPATQPVLAQAKVIVPSNVDDIRKPESVLFVFLKAQAGPGMPLAAVRLPAADLSVGEQLVQFTGADFIQQGSAQTLPDELYMQARLAVSGTPSPSDKDLKSDWVKVSKQDLSKVLILQLKP